MQSRTVWYAAIFAATVVGVVLIAASLGISMPFLRLDLRVGPTQDQASGVGSLEPSAPASLPSVEPPSPPLIDPTEPLLLARGDAMGMNEVVGYRFGEPVPPPHWPPVNAQPVSELPPEPLAVRPVLMNPDDVAREVAREHPPALREAGIGGVSHLWIHLDARGVVDAALIHETSGYEALDRAAVNVARTMVFNPAMSDEGPITAWVQIPIRFQVVD